MKMAEDHGNAGEGRADVAQRATRAIVLLSLSCAAAAYLVSLRVAEPRHAAWAAVAALAAAVGARTVPVGTEAVLLVAAFVAPGLLYFASGQPNGLLHTTWLVPMAAFLVAERPRAGWSMSRRWQWLLVTWALVVAACWPIVFLRELDLRWSFSVLSDASSNGLAPEPIWRWANGVAATALCSIGGLVWFDRLFARTGRTGSSSQFARVTIGACGVGLAVGGLVALYQSWVNPEFMSVGVWIQERRATGTLLDGNAVGIVAATWSVVLAGIVLPTASRGDGDVPVAGGRRFAVGAAMLAAGWLVVFASGSRTAFAAILLGSAFLAGGVATSVRLSWKFLLAAGVVFAALAVIVSAGAATGRLRTETPVRRIAASLPAPTFEEVGAFARSLWLRGGYGQASVAMIGEHPMTGIGIGTFSRQFVDYYNRATSQTAPPDNAQNWWRQQAAEFGLAGALFAVTLTVLAARLLIRRATPERRVAAGAVRGALVGLGAASLFGVPTLAPVAAFSAWTFLFLAVRLLEPPDPTHGITARTRGATAATVATVTCVLLVAFGQLHAATHDLRPPMRAMRAGMSYGHGFWRGGVDPDGQPFWLTGRRAVFVFPFGQGVLEFIAIPMHPDIESRPVQVTMWFDGERVLDQQARDHAPIRLRLPVRAGQRAVFVETRVSRTFVGAGGVEQGLRIEKKWEGPAPQ